MYAATAILAIVSLAAAQEVGFTDGDSIVAGPNAISNPNVNNGWQADSSLFAGSGSSGGSSNSGPQLFNDIVGSSFTKINSNTAFKDNLVNNPSVTFGSGNDGWTANGDRNELGPVQNEFGAVHKRGDVVFASNHHQTGSQVVHAARPMPVLGAYAKRGGDVVFGDTHHQANSQGAHFVAPPRFVHSGPVPAAFVKRMGGFAVAGSHEPFFYAWPAVAGLHPNARPVVVAQPALTESGEQKATIVQNHV
ncbi:hypothetical protein IWW43_006422 [Coemansia sp. RSA 1935]|nr:hypothetical protein IWW43_006422 [Coemansia sp. RSA 1935]